MLTSWATFSLARAPLAFLWLVVAVFLQRKELTETREAQGSLLEEHRKTTAREFDIHLSKNLDTLAEHVRIRSADLVIGRDGRLSAPSWW